MRSSLVHVTLSCVQRLSCIFVALFQSTDGSKCFTTHATFTHSHTHSGAIWGSVSCSRTLGHAAEGSRVQRNYFQVNILPWHADFCLKVTLHYIRQTVTESWDLYWWEWCWGAELYWNTGKASVCHVCLICDGRLFHPVFPAAAIKAFTFQFTANNDSNTDSLGTNLNTSFMWKHSVNNKCKW